MSSRNLLLIFVAFCFLFSSTNAQAVGPKFFKIAKVVDGDTIDVLINGKTQRVRLIGVDTPEVVDARKPVQCFGREASGAAKRWLEGREVWMESDRTAGDKDKYGRLLRYVWRSDGAFINYELIRQGFAHEFTYILPYRFQKKFKDAEAVARSNKTGLWSDSACAQESARVTATSSPERKCAIKGNIGAGNSKIYHLPNCDYYNKTVIDENKGEKWFCTEAEAVKAGWRKALNCN